MRRSRLQNLGPIHAGENFQLEKKIPEFANFWERDNLETMAEIFETSFWKLSFPFVFEPDFSEILLEWNAPQFNE